jgi:hypothetical protein
MHIIQTDPDGALSRSLRSPYGQYPTQRVQHRALTPQYRTLLSAIQDEIHTKAHRWVVDRAGCSLLQEQGHNE